MKNSEQEVEIKSIIDGVNILDKRRCGNSTRQINSAVEYLLCGFKIEVIDHAENTSGRLSEENSSFLSRRIMRRLKYEHNIDPDNVEYDKKTKIMWLILNKT